MSRYKTSARSTRIRWKNYWRVRLIHGIPISLLKAPPELNTKAPADTVEVTGASEITSQRAQHRVIARESGSLDFEELRAGNFC